MQRMLLNMALVMIFGARLTALLKLVLVEIFGCTHYRLSTNSQSAQDVLRPFLSGISGLT